MRKATGRVTENAGGLQPPRRPATRHPVIGRAPVPSTDRLLPASIAGLLNALARTSLCLPAANTTIKAFRQPRTGRGREAGTRHSQV